MALYLGNIRSVWGPVGPVQVQFQYDDGGTPVTDPPIDDDPAMADDVLVVVFWRNTNPLDASMSVIFKTSGRKEIYTMPANTPNWQTFNVPQNLQARRGTYQINGPFYPAIVEERRV
jgi:hypothetical protein